MALGLILLIVGILYGREPLVLGGVAFLLFGVVFLVLSFATRGQSD